jgi:hypothetical protein
VSVLAAARIVVCESVVVPRADILDVKAFQTEAAAGMGGKQAMDGKLGLKAGKNSRV